MKRVVNGVSYNTETSTEVAKFDLQDDGEGNTVVEVLYQTRGGAFFTYGFRRTVSLDPSVPDGRFEKETTTFSPLSREEAQDWVMTGNVEVYSDIFGDMPEAVEAAHPESTIYVRVPTSLKERIEAAAKAAGQSVNAWALRCLENGPGP
jgi:predicted HicB family RNase H-like nuclease